MELTKISFVLILMLFLKSGINIATGDFLLQKVISNQNADLNVKQQISYVKELIQVELAQHRDDIRGDLKNLLQNQQTASGIKVEIEPNRYDGSFNCIQKCGPILDLPSNCEEAMSSVQDKSGAYLLYVPFSGLGPFFAYCKRIDNKIWTVIQRRIDGTVDFYREWDDYRNGFGNLYGEFWLGLERLHAFTSKYKHELHVMVQDVNGRTTNMLFKLFSVASEDNNYKLKISGANVTGSIIGFGNGQDFSTPDFCNDRLCPAYGKGCPHIYKSAWWFYSCSGFIFNGLYNATNTNYWPDHIMQLKYSQLSIRRA